MQGTSGCSARGVQWIRADPSCGALAKIRHSQPDRQFATPHGSTQQLSSNHRQQNTHKVRPRLLRARPSRAMARRPREAPQRGVRRAWVGSPILNSRIFLSHVRRARLLHLLNLLTLLGSRSTRRARRLPGRAALREGYLSGGRGSARAPCACFTLAVVARPANSESVCPLLPLRARVRRPIARRAPRCPTSSSPASGLRLACAVPVLALVRVTHAETSTEAYRRLVGANTVTCAQGGQPVGRKPVPARTART